MYYVDGFRGCLVEEKDPYSPPERYYEYRCGCPGIVTESYIIDDSPVHTVTFAHVVNEDWEITSNNRKNFFKANNISENNIILYAYTVPPEWYAQMVEMCVKHEGE